MSTIRRRLLKIRWVKLRIDDRDNWIRVNRKITIGRPFRYLPLVEYRVDRIAIERARERMNRAVIPVQFYAKKEKGK